MTRPALFRRGHLPPLLSMSMTARDTELGPLAWAVLLAYALHYLAQPEPDRLRMTTCPRGRRLAPSVHMTPDEWSTGHQELAQLGLLTTRRLPPGRYLTHVEIPARYGPKLAALWKAQPRPPHDSRTARRWEAS